MVVRRRHPRLVVDVGEHLEAKHLVLVEKLESAWHVVPAIFPNEIGVRQQALEIDAHLLAALGTRVAGEARAAVGDELVKVVRHRLLRHRVSGETCDSTIAHAPDRCRAHRRQCLVKVLPAAPTTSHCWCGGGSAVRYVAAAPRPRHDRAINQTKWSFQCDYLRRWPRWPCSPPPRPRRWRRDFHASTICRSSPAARRRLITIPRRPGCSCRASPIHRSCR